MFWFNSFLKIQLNKYIDSSIFFLLNENLTCNCLLISVFFLNFTEFAGSEHTILDSDLANYGKNTEINKQSHVKFWFDRKKIWSCLIFIKLYINLTCYDYDLFFLKNLGSITLNKSKSSGNLVRKWANYSGTELLTLFIQWRNGPIISAGHMEFNCLVWVFVCCILM